MMMRLVQFELNNGQRRVGVVQDDLIREVTGCTSVREVALAAIDAGVSLAQQIEALGPSPDVHIGQGRRDAVGMMFGMPHRTESSPRATPRLSRSTGSVRVEYGAS